MGDAPEAFSARALLSRLLRLNPLIIPMLVSLPLRMLAATPFLHNAHAYSDVSLFTSVGVTEFATKGCQRRVVSSHV